MPYSSPGERDLQNPRTLGRGITSQQRSPGGLRTTQSMSGIPQQQTTAPALSDVLQGTLGVRGPEDLTLVVNKALSGHLDSLYAGGFAGVGTFSTAPRSPLLEGTVVGQGGIAGGGGTAGQGVGIITREQAAQLSYWVGWRGEDVVTATAIMGRESNYDPGAYNPNASTQDLSFGLFQINMLGDMGPSRRAWFGISTNEELYDPIINATAAHKMDMANRQSGKVPFYDWGPYKGRPPTYSTDVPAARAAVERAQQQGLLGKQPVFMVTGGGGALPEAMTGGSLVSIADMKYAGQIIANHPNNWMAKENGGFRARLLEGNSSGMNNKVIYHENGRAFLFPSLLNYLYTIFEGGFILSQHWGDVVNKRKNNGDWSFHAYGGAIDIGAIGLASERKVYALTSRDGRRVGDRMFTYMASLPRNGRADENASAWGQTYGDLRVYVDPNPNHVHLGYAPTRSGVLMPALRRRQTASSAVDQIGNWF